MRVARIFSAVCGFFLCLLLCLSFAFADSYSVYDGTPSSTYVNYLSACMENKSGNYVIWRNGQYEYKLAFGSDLRVADGVFTGSVDMVTLSNSSSYNSIYQMFFSSDSSFVLNNSNDYIIFSNLENYPDICGGVKSYEVQTIVVALAIPFAFALIYLLFRCVRRW